ncbi:cytochrome P450 family protein [Ceratobasidium sp. AG-Ba]|nr:cytochrome P450 family protein [Ceratobasidium sp. AG-Ba]
MADMLLEKMQLVAGALAVAVSFWAIYRWLKPKPIPGFPHNPITSIFGDIPEFIRLMKDEQLSLVDYVALLVERHGPAVQFFIGKSVTLLVADHAEIDRLYLRGKSIDMSDAIIAAFQHVLPTGQIALPTNTVWKSHRRIIGPAMHRRYLSRMAPHVCAAANQLVDLWSVKANIACGESFNASPDIKLSTMDSINSIITGQPFGCLARALYSTTKKDSSKPGVAEFSSGSSPSVCQAINTMMDSVTFALQLPFSPVLFPIYLLFNRKWHRDRQRIRSYLWTRVEEAKKREDMLTESSDLLTDADCVIDMIIQQELRESSETFSKEEMLDELMTFFMAGQETTAVATSWFVKFIALDFDIQRRLHEEVCAVFGDSLTDMSSITLDTLDDPERIPILEAVTAETLRCGLVGPASKRRLVADELIMGRHVPKGTEIMALNGLLGLSEAAWGDDAKQWRPSRWLRADGSFDRNAGPTGYPFGIGPRACFGQRLAMMQLKIFIATFSRAFVFRSVAPSVNSWASTTIITNRPIESYVALDRWGP